jgi:hypothetical protein
MNESITDVATTTRTRFGLGVISISGGQVLWNVETDEKLFAFMATGQFGSGKT